jgi:hypothetical protein
MCDECLEIATQIDPEFLKLMNDLEPEYRALEIKVGERIKTILGMTVVDQDGEVKTDDLDPEQLEEIRNGIVQLSGVMGMGALLGWHCISHVNDKDEAMMLMHPLMGIFNRSLNDSLAYISVRSAPKH